MIFELTPIDMCIDLWEPKIILVLIGFCICLMIVIWYLDNQLDQKKRYIERMR